MFAKEFGTLFFVAFWILYFFPLSNWLNKRIKDEHVIAKIFSVLGLLLITYIFAYLSNQVLWIIRLGMM